MNKRNNVQLVLILLVVVLGIGYAYINSDLNINGTAKIKNANWDIHWANVQISSGSVTGDNVVTEPTIDSEETTVTYSVVLPTPGTYYEFTVDAVNAGSIDAMIDTIDSKLNGATITTLPEYLSYDVTYSDGLALQPNHELKANTTETYKVILKYRDDIELSQIPASDQTLSLEFTVTYRQATDDSQAVPRSAYVYTVNKYDSSVTEPKYNGVWLNQAFPASITQYNTPSETLTAIATASSKDLPFYLKHKIENGVVTESYVEFVVTEAMAQANSGMVPGTYTLRGGKTYEDGTGYIVDTSYISPYYEANKEEMKRAFGYVTNPSRCSENGTGRSSALSCSVSGLVGWVGANDNVIASAGSSACYVHNMGCSRCDW